MVFLKNVLMLKYLFKLLLINKNANVFPMALGKRKTGMDDAPSVVEILQELSHDIQVAYDK